MATTVLILEDDPHTVEVVQLYLRRDGHTVLSATDGIAGLSLAREAQPDLIVLDLMLPGRMAWRYAEPFARSRTFP